MISRPLFSARSSVLRTASYPRQFGEGEHGIFTGDIVPKILTLCLKWSTKAISAKEHPTWCSWCQISAPGLPPAGGSAKRAAPTQWRKTGWRGETEAYAARPCPTASATAPHLASSRWGEVEPGNIFSGNRLKALHTSDYAYIMPCCTARCQPGVFIA